MLVLSAWAVLWAQPSGTGTATVVANAVIAASCSQAHVAAATSAAVDGDTVLIPAGTCTWTTAVTVANKAITIRGGGVGVTTIVDGTTGGALKLTVSAADFMDIGHMTFQKSTANSNGIVQITGVPGQVGFRFHHSRIFDNAVAGGRGLYVFAGDGLIDHVAFDLTHPSYAAQMLSVAGSLPNVDGGYTPWGSPLAIGTDQAVYVEDCTFTSANQGEDTIDAYSGARLVIRHNTFTDTSVGFHGTDSGGMRSVVSVELYANTFTNNSSNDRRAVTNRGGTALYFDNTYGGSRGYSLLTLLYYRAMIDDSYGWGQCDGTAYDIGSTNFSSNESRATTTYGTVARFSAANPDTVCTGSTSGDCSRGFDGGGSRGYPCRDQPGRGPGQQLAPVYAWNNTSGIVIGVYDDGCTICDGYPSTTWLLENRDYYNYVASGFDGTVGVGRGVLASRPATCTPLTAYWATDTQTLYQCATTDTWTTYYTPYTYPHPLNH